MGASAAFGAACLQGGAWGLIDLAAKHVPGGIPLYVDYHDNECGRPIHDDREPFGLLVLGGAQAGLPWMTILEKREEYRRSFDGFDPAEAVLSDEEKADEFMANAGIVRSRLTVSAAIANTKLFLHVIGEFGSFDTFAWDYMGGPLENRWRNEDEIPTSAPLSDRIRKDLEQRGLKFVGSTIVYACMRQSTW